MGITGLLPFLKSIQHVIHMSKFSGETLVIDAYGWLHKGVYCCALEIVEGKDSELRYVKYCIKKVNLLLSFNITPILVFDGGYLPSKKKTEEKRRKQREAFRQKGLNCLRDGLRSEAISYFQKCLDVTPEMAHNLIRACREIGVNCIVAPYEADAQLAYMVKNELAYAVISEDSDLLVFGCTRVIFKMDDAGSGILINLSELGSVKGHNMLGFNVESFRHMCILSGCDYLENISGVGLVTAHKLMRKHCFEAFRVIRVLRCEPNKKVPPGYEEKFKQADMTFIYQLVYDPRSDSVVPLNAIPTEFGETDLSFAGFRLSPTKASAISRGLINPITYEKMNNYEQMSQDPIFKQKSVKQTKINSSAFVLSGSMQGGALERHQESIRHFMKGSSNLDPPTKRHCTGFNSALHANTNTNSNSNSNDKTDEDLLSIYGSGQSHPTSLISVRETEPGQTGSDQTNTQYKTASSTMRNAFSKYNYNKPSSTTTHNDALINRSKQTVSKSRVTSDDIENKNNSNKNDKDKDNDYSEENVYIYSKYFPILNIEDLQVANSNQIRHKQHKHTRRLSFPELSGIQNYSFPVGDNTHSTAILTSHEYLSQNSATSSVQNDSGINSDYISSVEPEEMIHPAELETFNGATLQLCPASPIDRQNTTAHEQHSVSPMETDNTIVCKNTVENNLHHSNDNTTVLQNNTIASPPLISITSPTHNYKSPIDIFKSYDNNSTTITTAINNNNHNNHNNNNHNNHNHNNNDDDVDDDDDTDENEMDSISPFGNSMKNIQIGTTPRINRSDRFHNISNDDNFNQLALSLTPNTPNSNSDNNNNNNNNNININNNYINMFELPNMCTIQSPRLNFSPLSNTSNSPVKSPELLIISDAAETPPNYKPPTRNIFNLSVRDARKSKSQNIMRTPICISSALNDINNHAFIPVTPPNKQTHLMDSPIIIMETPPSNKYAPLKIDEIIIPETPPNVKDPIANKHETSNQQISSKYFVKAKRPLSWEPNSSQRRPLTGFQPANKQTKKINKLSITKTRQKRKPLLHSPEQVSLNLFSVKS